MSDKKALAVIDASVFPALRDDSGVSEAMAANLPDAALRESDLTRVPIPSGGSTTWVIPSITGETTAKTIDGILAVVVPRGVLWPTEEPAEGTLPVLVTHDLKTAHAVNLEGVDSALLKDVESCRNEDGSYSWLKLPQNEWGSGKGGRGKCCKEQRVIYLLTKEQAMPIVIVVAPGSLKGWQGFLVGLTTAGIPHYRAVVSFGLEADKNPAGIPFARIVPKLVGVLDKDAGEAIRKKFTEPLRGVARFAFSQ